MFSASAGRLASRFRPDASCCGPAEAVASATARRYCALQHRPRIAHRRHALDLAPACRIRSLQGRRGRRTWTVAVLAFCCALRWTDVLAGETSQTESILVEGHYDNAVGSSETASQGTIAGKLLEDIPLLRPGEVLETVPGLVVTQHSGDGKANQYFLRGYNLDHGTDFATSIDGVPVNMPTNAHGQGYSDLNYLIPELVERIDYFKGPYFAQAGDFSAAGAANIRYRSRLDHNLGDLTLGSFGYRRALLAGSVPVTLAGSAGGAARPNRGASAM